MYLELEHWGMCDEVRRYDTVSRGRRDDRRGPEDDMEWNLPQESQSMNGT